MGLSLISSVVCRTERIEILGRCCGDRTAAVAIGDLCSAAQKKRGMRLRDMAHNSIT